jgi:hypothetical protein
MLDKSGEISTLARMAEIQWTRLEAKEMEPRRPSDSEVEHEFVLVLTGITEVDTEAEDALFEAGCDDATISASSGRVCLTFSRAARSKKDAILSAIQDVMKAKIGAQVLRVDESNLINQAEIARKIGRSRQLVHQFIVGTRGPGGFPPPSCHITDDAPLWRWCEVANWLWQNGMIKEDALYEAQDIEMINSVLDFVHQKRINPDFVEEFATSLQNFGASRNEPAGEQS